MEAFWLVNKRRLYQIENYALQNQTSFSYSKDSQIFKLGGKTGRSLFESYLIKI